MSDISSDSMKVIKDKRAFIFYFGSEVPYGMITNKPYTESDVNVLIEKIRAQMIEVINNGE